MLVISKIREYLSEEVPPLTKNEKWVMSFASGLFIFLFMIFFQPFGVNNYDSSEQIRSIFLLSMARVGLVTSLSIAFNELIIYPFFVKTYSRINHLIWIIWSIIWLGTSIFFNYNITGGWHDFRWSSYFEFIGNVGIVCLIPIAAVVVYSKIKSLRNSLDSVSINLIQNTNLADHTISIIAQNGKDKFVTPLKNLIYIESDDNYVSIYHIQNGQLVKKLLRKSIKSIQEENHTHLIRCHRSIIINTYHLERIEGNRNKLSVNLNGVSKAIPVSRQYIDAIYQLSK